MENLTSPELQGCCGSSCIDRKPSCLHRGIPFDFIVNVLNPRYYPPNTLNATSLVFSSRLSFVRKFLATATCRDKAHQATCEGYVLSLCQLKVHFMALHATDSKINVLLNPWRSINRDSKAVTGTVRE